MLGEERLFSVDQKVCFLRGQVVVLRSFERMTLEQVLIEKHGQSEEVGQKAWDDAAHIARRKIHRGKHLGRDIALCARNLGRVQARHDERVDVDDDAAATLGINEDVVAR